MRNNLIIMILFSVLLLLPVASPYDHLNSGFFHRKLILMLEYQGFHR